jgi:hypothetical protein
LEFGAPFKYNGSAVNHAKKPEKYKNHEIAMICKTPTEIDNNYNHGYSM